MSASGVYAAAEPFADAGAGFAYFGTDHHYRQLAEQICGHLAERPGFVLVTGEPPPDGELVTRYLDGGADSGYRATLVRSRAGMQFDDVVKICNRQLGLESEEEGGGLWSLLSHLMLEARKGLTRILVLEMADGLDDRALDELHRFAKLDEPNVVPIVLLSSPGFLDRLDGDELQFLDGAIIGRLALQRLEPQEVGAFIHFQLNTIAPEEGVSLPADTIAAIASAAQGDPGAVNRLARTALAGRRAARARPGARPVRLPADTDDHHEAAPVRMAPDDLAAMPREAPKPTPPEPLRLSAPTILALPNTDEEDEEEAIEEAAEEEAEDTPSRGAFLQPFLRPLLRLAPVGYVLVAFVSGLAVLSFLAVNHFRPEKAPVVEASLPPLSKVPLTVAPSVAAPKPVAAATIAPPPSPPVKVAAADTVSPPPLPPAPPAAAAAPPPPRVTPATPSPTVAAAKASAPTPAPSLAPAAAAAEPPAPVPDARLAEAEAALSPSAAPSDVPVVAATPAPPPDPPKAAPPPAVAMVEPVVPQPNPPPAIDAQPTADFTMLVRRGDQLLATGDIASARRFFERAAESGDALALCGLGKSYDPLFLRQLATRGVPPDAAKAASWYRKAAGAGSIEASVRLEQLLASYPQ